MSASDDKTLSSLIKEKAKNLGFDLCGITAARALTEREDILKNWCSSGMNAGMTYLSRDMEKRLNPEFLVPGARSLIVTGINYYTENQQTEPGVPVLSIYAYGESYQEVIKRRLDELLQFVRSVSPEAEGRAFSDTAPLLEKAWAVEAGIGWQGKHSVVINKKIGSFFFIGILIVNIELEYDEPFSKDYCGNCRICIEQCPTGAINEDRTIDARKCIANLTIENRGPVPEEIIPLLEGRIYGCDKCQEVCPWNCNALPTKVPEFQIEEELAGLTAGEWSNMSGERFKKLFNRTPVGRKKYETFIENIALVTKSEN
ncbi:MAG: tRNA epoxyqueuosine(34) reductase QueG [Bacteroidales bacterium]|nr:tRNA epoxyqueuosine(34) reductase QueG [Bacteroidales bacterium]